MSERKGTKALELWCKRLVRDCPEVRIDNMTTSWRNGIAFCALVHHFRPDLIDMRTLKPENIYENNQLAFSLAEKHLGIPALLDPEDMVDSDIPDRLSILTYLSQFYQRLGHTVNTKVPESESKVSLSQALPPAQPPAPLKFGKAGLDKCTACGLPVYLAQRLLVSHKLYHRRCFRCSICSGHLNPKNFDIIERSEFKCDSCRNEKSLPKIFNNNNHHEQMGMLAYNDDFNEKNLDISIRNTTSPKHKLRPQSILDKISMFEKIDKESSINNKMLNLSITDDSVNLKDINNTSITNEPISKQPLFNVNNLETEYIPKTTPEKIYKSNIDKFNFLQTQLLGEALKIDTPSNDLINKPKEENEEDLIQNNSMKNHEIEIIPMREESLPCLPKQSNEENNITDDIRLSINNNSNTNLNESIKPEHETEEEIKISVPPRRRRHNVTKVKSDEIQETPKKIDVKEYPDYLNPFSDDDDDEHENIKQTPKKVSTNPFGSTDEEDDDVLTIPQPLPRITTTLESSTPVKRLIAVNPFWSDGEEPASDEETQNSSGSSMHKSSITTSTPNLLGSVSRRKKARAPHPPHPPHSPHLSHSPHSPHLSNSPHPPHSPLPAALSVSGPPRSELSASIDDVASISSLSSYNSTLNSDQKSMGRSTPLSKKKRPAPSQPDNVSLHSGTGEFSEKSVDTSGGRRVKGPAPGLPLPERREVKMQMSAEQLQVQLDMLETQQLGLERQGVLIEKMIRDKCEGDEAITVPQEEVEDLVIQLCELVNEKNDLFRKQTELMYIRRQQRLEQEQADIEHEIRIIQSRPAVNRIDADKAREEQLVSRLVEIVRMRDELVQQIEAERRRERQEDLAIAASIATKRAQRLSESNSSSIKSMEVLPTPKKSKVKDKVKKQLKKAKHTLISKKKDESSDRKEEKSEKKSK